MQKDDNFPGFFGLGESVLAHITSDLLQKNHHVYFDNYFPSVSLMEYLKTRNGFACATIRAYRKYLPHNLTTVKVMKRGGFDYRISASEIMYFKWMGNKPVHIISNFHDTEQTMILMRQRDGLQFPCPKDVKDYNSYMEGVDKAMIFSIYGVGRKSNKRWRHIFFGLISRTLCNAYVVYKKLIEPSIRSLEFHCSTAQSKKLAHYFLHQVVSRPKSLEKSMILRT